MFCFINFPLIISIGFLFLFFEKLFYFYCPQLYTQANSGYFFLKISLGLLDCQMFCLIRLFLRILVSFRYFLLVISLSIFSCFSNQCIGLCVSFFEIQVSISGFFITVSPCLQLFPFQSALHILQRSTLFLEFCLYGCCFLFLFQNTCIRIFTGNV